MFHQLSLGSIFEDEDFEPILLRSANGCANSNGPAQEDSDSCILAPDPIAQNGNPGLILRPLFVLSTVSVWDLK